MASHLVGRGIRHTSGQPSVGLPRPRTRGRPPARSVVRIISPSTAHCTSAQKHPLSLFHLRSELAECRVRTAWTRPVSRVVTHRSLRRSRQDLRVALACSASARASMMSCSRAAPTSWTATGSAGEAHNGRPKRSARTCTVIPCLSCFPSEVGPVRCDPVDRQQGPVQQRGRLRRCSPRRLREGRRESRQDLNGPLRCTGTPSWSGCRTPPRAAHTGDRRRRRWARVSRASRSARRRRHRVPRSRRRRRSLAGRKRGGRTGHVDTRWVDKHTKPVVESDFLVEAPPTRGFTCLSAQLTVQFARPGRAHSRK